MTPLLHLIITLGCSPFIFLTKVARKQNNTRRVLVVQRAKIGDMVCTTPLFKALKNYGDHVTVIGLNSTIGVLEQNPDVDEFLSANHKKYQGFFGRLKLFGWIHRGKFDVCIVVMPGGANCLMSIWSAAKQRVYTVGPTVAITEKLCMPWMFQVLEYKRHMRTFDHYMLLAEAVGAKPVPYEHHMYLSQDETEEAELWLSRHSVDASKPFSIVSVAAGNKIKEWPLERFAEVADYIAGTYNMPVIVSTLDTVMTADTIGYTNQKENMVDAGGISLRLLTAIIARSKLWVSVDTGPLYIAHAFGVPLVNIVGPVDPHEQPPIPSPKVEIVVPPNIAPSSFVIETLREETPDQMRAIQKTTVQMVTDAIDRVLIS